MEDSPGTTSKEPKSAECIIYNFQLGPTASPKHSELLQIPHWSIKATKEFFKYFPWLIFTHITLQTVESMHTLLGRYRLHNKFYKTLAIWHPRWQCVVAYTMIMHVPKTGMIPPRHREGIYQVPVQIPWVHHDKKFSKNDQQLLVGPWLANWAKGEF